MKRYLGPSEWHQIRSMLGNAWAMLFFMIGGREVGKSYAVVSFFVSQWRQYGRPFYWLRLTDTSAGKLLQNNAEKLIDPDIRRFWGLDLVTNGDAVYEVKRDEKGKIIEKKLMARVLALSTFYNDKGSGLFDKDFLNDPKMYYNICLDEMNREEGERKTFDITYAFANELENLVRSTKQRIRVICIGNTLAEASDILSSLNFIPREYGRYYLRKKRAVVDYIENSDRYLARREGTLADILCPSASTFTNDAGLDTSLVTKQRLISPTLTLKFSKSKHDWFTLWDDGIVAKYNNEKIPSIAMRPYIDDKFYVDRQRQVLELFNIRYYRFHNLLSYVQFKNHLALIKPG